MNAPNENDLPRSRAEGLRLATRFYFTGKACINGHVAKRLSGNGHCTECDRARGRIRSIKARADNPEKTREYYRKYSRNYYQRNIDAVRDYHKNWQREARSNPSAALNNRMSVGISKSITSGSKQRRPWESLVGYTVSDLMAHIEKLFLPGMTWENYGDWHVDHKIPKSAFNYETPDDIDFNRCWALSNLQPLWAADNIRKHARLDAPFQPSLALKA